jgi:class 3 adenylate cyclase/tetratricopeptide (TPR) repeat protein
VCGKPGGAGRFCEDCGARLVAPGLGLGEAGAGGEPLAERRVASVLFADLVAFTTAAEKRDPEEVRELLSRYFAECRTVIGRYGGVVEKFIGDAVMAVWGVPVSLGDDAERAVRAGLELLQTVSAFGEEVGAPGLSLRVGVVTGPVAVTLGAAGEGMVAGDTVNTASRVQSTAAPGEVWVDESTRSLTSASIAYEDVGVHLLKGRSSSIHLFSARDVVAAVGGAQRVDGLEAPLTGRARELRLIKELFHAAEETGRPSLLVVEGEAGVGKSRLAWEFEKYIDGLLYTVRWHRGRCLAYGEGVAFWALAEAVRGRLGLVESDLTPVVVQQLDEGLDRFVPDPEEQAWIRPRLLALVGAATAGSYAREDLFAAWTVFFERVGAGECPVVLLVDDAQHADEGFLAFLDHLLASARFPLFVVALSRPGLIERRPALAANRHASILRLPALSEQDVEALLDGLVSGLPERARSVMAARAEGVPLFAVETVRGLIDRNLVVPRGGRYVVADPDALVVEEIAAPASLYALVSARLDALPPAARRLVADASVLGAAFTRTAIAVMAPDVDDLDSMLESLVRLEILAMQSDRFNAEFGQYRFEQAVVRQVAYETLSRRERKRRHLAVAAYYCDQPDPGDDLAPLIAQHFLDALTASAQTDDDQDELSVQAIEWLERAAVRARRLGSPEEGFRHLLTALAGASDPHLRIRLAEALAWCGIDAGEYEQAIGYAESAVSGYTAAGDPIGAGRAAAAMGTALSVGLGDTASSVGVLEAHWTALQGVEGATNSLLRLSRILGITYRQMARYAEAQAMVETRIRLAQAMGADDEMPDALNELGVGYLQTGAPYVGRVLATAAADLARQQGQPVALARALNNLGSELIAIDLASATSNGAAALAAARQSGASSWIALTMANLMTTGWTSGRWDLVDDLLAEPNWRNDHTVAPVGLSVVRRLDAARGSSRAADVLTADTRAVDDQGVVAWVAVVDMLDAEASGALPEAVRLGEQAVSHFFAYSGSSDDFIQAWPMAVDVAFAAGDLAAVDRMLAVADSTPPGLLTLGQRAHRLRYAALVAQRVGTLPLDEVVETMRQAVALFDEWGAVPYRAVAQDELGQWLVAASRRDEGEALLDSARSSFVQLGAHAWAEAADLRRAALNLAAR